jgi:starch synthase (maltosyl-transferring)
MEHVARPGSGEYIDNEKYELKDWPIDRPDSLRHLLKRINRIRNHHPALHDNRRLVFHRSDNPNLLAYSKTSGDGSDRVLVVVNVDWHNTHAGHLELDLDALGVDPYRPFEVHDLISDARYSWQGHRNYVCLSPDPLPCHVFHVLPNP